MPVTSLWFGDSIVQGCCRTLASSPTMAEVASKALGWQAPHVEAFGGTGYLSTVLVYGVTRPAYPDKIGWFVVGASYRVVIIGGGNNDARAGFSPQAFRAAARSTFQQVRRALPNARLVVLGPYSSRGTGYTYQRMIEREEAARAGALFIDGIAEGWFRGEPDLTSNDEFCPSDRNLTYLGRPLIGGKTAGCFTGRPDLLSSDGFHPNDAGQAYLGARVAAHLRALNLL